MAQQCPGSGQEPRLSRSERRLHRRPICPVCLRTRAAGLTPRGWSPGDLVPSHPPLDPEALVPGAMPCERCGCWRVLDAAGVCGVCGDAASAAVLQDLQQDERGRSQAALEAWLGLQVRAGRSQ